MMVTKVNSPIPRMTDAGLNSCYEVTAFDEFGKSRQIELAGERALTVYVDKYEIVTLMTIGTHPELLTLGYLRNQGFIENIEDIEVVQVDWESEAVAVVTRNTAIDFKEKMSQRTITTGCGQGTVFGRAAGPTAKNPYARYKNQAIHNLRPVFHLERVQRSLQKGRCGPRLRPLFRQSDRLFCRGCGPA